MKICEKCNVEKSISQFSFAPRRNSKGTRGANDRLLPVNEPSKESTLYCCKECEALFIKCYECKQYKTYAEFSNNKTRRNGKQTYCKQCGKEHQTEWYYRQKHKITVDERDEMLTQQGGKCKICNTPIGFVDDQGRHGNVGNVAVVDHCHSSDKIRGILCGYCNVGIGSFRDNTDYLFGAIKYLSSGEL